MTDHVHEVATAGITFSDALTHLKTGARIAREGWNGKGMWLNLVQSKDYTALNIHNGLLPWIGMKTVDDCFVPWIASQTDLLSEDWFTLSDENA